MGSKRKCALCIHSDPDTAQQNHGQKQSFMCSVKRARVQDVCERYTVAPVPAPVPPYGRDRGPSSYQRPRYCNSLLLST